MTKSVKHNIWFSLFVVFVLSLTALSNCIPYELTEFKFLFWTIKDTLFESVYWLYWMLTFKLVIIFTCLGWYLTCGYWWRFAILIPLFIEIFKLFELLSPSASFDETNYIDSLPFTLPIILVFIVLSIKDIRYRQNRMLLKNLDQEIDTILSKKISQQKIHEYERDFLALTESKTSIPLNVYLKRLGEIKKQLETQC